MRHAFALLAFLAAGFVSAVPGLAQTRGASANVIEVKHCNVSLVEEAQVPSQEAGVIMAMNVKEGQTVKKGELLAKIDDTVPRAEKKKATAEKNAAKEKADSDVELRYAKAAKGVAYYEWQKNLEAYNTAKAVPWVEVMRLDLAHQGATLKIEQAEVERRVAALTVDVKEAEVDAADEAINHRQIRSPIDGVVEQIVPHVGEWVKPGDNVMRVVRLDRLKVGGYLNTSKYSPEEIRDRPVIVTVGRADSKEPLQFKGKIVHVSSLDTIGGEFYFWAEVENRPVTGRTDAWLLRPNALATMTIDLGNREAGVGSRESGGAATAPVAGPIAR